MMQNKLPFYFLMCMASLWLGCGSAKMSEAEVQQYASQIETMQAANRAQLKHNAVSGATLTKEIGKQYNNGIGEFIWVNEVVQIVRKDRHDLLTTIRGCREELEKLAGKDAQLGTFSTPNEYSATQELMMGGANANGGRGNGEAKNLRHEARGLHETIMQAKRNEKLEIPQIAKDSTGPLWEAQHFGNASALIALRELELLTHDALAIEARLIDDFVAEMKLTEKVKENAALQPKGKMALSWIPYADTVAAGMKMEALLMVENLPFGACVDFHGSDVSNNKIGVDNSTGLLSLLLSLFQRREEWRDYPSGNLFSLSPSEFANDKDTMSQSQKVYATVTLPEGDEEELSGTCHFVTRKPRAVLTPGPQTPLRKGQANKMKIDVPDFGEYYSPKIEASDATVEVSPLDRSSYTIIPTGNTTTISISSSTNGKLILVDRVTFQVKD